MVALLFAQFFGASCDSIEHFLHLALASLKNWQRSGAAA
jgi:hypothetical protein